MMRYKTHLFILISLLVIFSPGDLFAGQLSGIFPKGLKPNGIVFGLSLFLALITALTVHELGHLLTGLALGFRFQLFIVFLLGIKRTEKGIQVFLNKNLGYMGGVASTTPITKGVENRRKFAFMVLAGPVASLLFAILSFLFMVFTKNILWTFWLVAGATSIGLFLATTIPSKSGIYFTDRARFQRLISKGKEGKAEEALLQLIAQTTMDNSCKNISLENTHTLQTDKEAFMRFWGYYYEYEYFKANENVPQTEKAKAHLLSLKETISKPIWKALQLDD